LAHNTSFLESEERKVSETRVSEACSTYTFQFTLFSFIMHDFLKGGESIDDVKKREKVANYQKRESIDINHWLPKK